MQPERNKTLFEGKRVSATKLDGFVLYATLLKMEEHGVWLQIKNTVLFVTYNNLKEIRLDERGEY